MRLIRVGVFFCVVLHLGLIAQNLGCTDFKAINYNPNASINDGSCKYKNTSVAVLKSWMLPNSLVETSGLSYWANKFWTHNDDTDLSLYAFDTTQINNPDKFELKNTSNTDWEEVAQDSLYFYVGDFGNNFGNRKDLHLLRIQKHTLFTHQPLIDTIWFNYETQTNFNPGKAQATNFDAEAFVIGNDSIYLFTKEWLSKKTTVYRLPKLPGNYEAKYVIDLDVGGYITGATYTKSKNSIVLCGYDNLISPFLYLIYDLKNFQFAPANKRKVNVLSNFYQVEGICSPDGKIYYLSNEQLNKSFIRIPQQLHKIDLQNLLED